MLHSPGSGDSNVRLPPEKVMERAQASARMEEDCRFHDIIEFICIKDHILPSMCKHVNDVVCHVCKYNNELQLPHLPEMIFPNNKLALRKIGCKNDFIIEFNAFDALKQVDAKNLPNVEVGPSLLWKEARKSQLESLHTSQPFDWTYTSEYAGTISHTAKIEETDETIDIEKLKRRDPIKFYTELTLYEDELADHGCAHMGLRIRVMPTMFFVLCRFYLRVDNVMVRTCDTRIFGEKGCDYVLREWTMREAMNSTLTPKQLEVVNDENLIWQHLPTVKSKSWKIHL